MTLSNVGNSSRIALPTSSDNELAQAPPFGEIPGPIQDGVDQPLSEMARGQSLGNDLVYPTKATPDPNGSDLVRGGNPIGLPFGGPDPRYQYPKSPPIQTPTRGPR